MNLPLSSRLRRGLTVVSAVALAAGMAGLTASTATAASASTAHTRPHVSIAKELSHGAHASQPAMTKADSRSRHACAAVIVVGHQSCMLLKRDGLHPILASASPDAIPAGVGYGPSQLQSAYNLTSASASNGAGRTIALVDAYDDPTAAADLAAYRSAAGPARRAQLQEGQPERRDLAAARRRRRPATTGPWRSRSTWTWPRRSARCATSCWSRRTNDSGTGLYVAENAAASLAGYISNSWGGSESSSDTTLDSTYFNHPGDVITASAGDSDFGVIYPATSPNVVSVGGTSAEHRLELARLDRVGLEHHNRLRGHRLGLLGLSSRSRPGRPRSACPAAPSASTTTSPRTPTRPPGSRSTTPPTATAAGTRSAAPAPPPRCSPPCTPSPATPAPPRPTTSTPTPATSSTSPPATTARCSPAYLCTAETGYDGPTGIGTPNGIAGLVSRRRRRQHRHRDQPRQPDRHRRHRGLPADPRHRLGVWPDADLHRHRPAGRPVDQLAPA